MVRVLYVINAAWEDLEQEAHLGRTFTVLDRQPLGAGLPSADMTADTPPVMVSLPDVLSRFSRQTKELFSIVYTWFASQSETVHSHARIL